MRKGEMLSKIFGTTLVFVMIVVVCLGAVAAQPVAGTTEASDPPCTCGDICVNTTGWWRAGGTFNASATPIQSAVDNATSGETICVKDGLYHENVDVGIPHLTIQSENGTANCVVNASNSNDHVFYVTANYVNIIGFTVENATGSSRAGIYLNSTSHCNISNNTATNNYYGIHLLSSTNNTLTNNTANSNSYGIRLYSASTNNTLTNNTALNNTNYGIRLNSSSNNTLTNNAANSNTYGISLNSSSDNNLINNTANWNNDDGIWLLYSSNNTLTNNTANWNNDGGIYLWFSSNNNTLMSNTASNNTQYGIYLWSSSNNTIYNNYFNNTNNAWDDGNNTWNTTKQAGTNIIGGPYLGGNYWSDYNGTDTDGDGLGNTLLPYNCTGNITNGGDWLPLVVWTGATLEGNVTFLGRGSNNTQWIEDFVVRGFEQGNLTNELWNGTATTNNTGVLTMTGLTPGTYDIGIKNWTCLSEVVTNVTLTAGNTTVVDFGTTREGDANNDDWVTCKDFDLLAASWATIEGGPYWNPHCDFNRNGWIDLDDLILMAWSWGLSGDLPPSGGEQPGGDGWGFEIQPNMTRVGLGENFTVNVTAVHYSGDADCWAMYLLFNTTYLEVTGIDTPSTLPDYVAPIIFVTEWNNTAGWAQTGCGGGAFSYINETFVHCTIHFRAKSVNGTSYLNFTWLDLRRVTEITCDTTDHLNWSYVVNGTVEIGTTLEGHVNFSRVDPGPKWVRGLNVSFFDNATQNETGWSPKSATTNSSGWFNVSGLAPGTYNIGIKNWTSLSEMNWSVTLTAGNTTVVEFDTPLEGDCDDNDHVAYSDYIDLLIHYDEVYANADFDRSGKVGYFDYIDLLMNYDEKGDVRLYTT